MLDHRWQVKGRPSLCLWTFERTFSATITRRNVVIGYRESEDQRHNERRFVFRALLVPMAPDWRAMASERGRESEIKRQKQVVELTQ